MSFIAVFLSFIQQTLTMHPSLQKHRNKQRKVTNEWNSFVVPLLFIFIFLIGTWTGWACSIALMTKSTTSSTTTTSRTNTHYQIARRTTQPSTHDNSGDQNRMSITSDQAWKDLIRSLGSEKLFKIAQEKQDEYNRSYPFPHLVLDDLFPKSILQALLEEIPESLIGFDGCHEKHSFCKKSQITDNQFKKSSINNEEDLGPVTREVILYLQSGVFIEFLKRLTGIRGIIPDPTLLGAGVHLTSHGGKLDIHSDFNAYAGPKLDRRVNLFLFLNPDWSDQYGGHLEFWNRDLTKCGARVAPVLGRLVIFSTNDFSYHGHPHPLTCPKDRVRRSIALYYYTVGRPSQDCLHGVCPVYEERNHKMRIKHGHGTLWKKSVNCETCAECLVAGGEDEDASSS